ncbi:MAG: trypsin-like peptidase domain-containing protein, partial [Thermoanaerobaculia bacterium]|nr:trypsin-like peptidase domain-containing protein [Thermoanaerobaculia bacterium]
MREGRVARALVFLILVAVVLYAGLLWQSLGQRRPADDRDEVPGAGIESPSRPEADAEPAAGPGGREPALAAEPRAKRRGGLLEREWATIELFRQASPAVVYITTVDVRRDFFTMNDYAVPSGAGSGFVWDKKGHIVTNYHVIRGADDARVTLSDHSQWPATLVGLAREKDLAVLRIDAPPDRLDPLPVGSSGDLMVGQSVYAIGNPFGLDHTLTTGVISALGREIQSLDPQRTRIEDVIQTDAAINPGNSGGPLLDSSGRLIGVNTQIYSPSGASAGIGFAIPVDTVAWVVPDLIEHGRIRRPTLGIYPVADATARRAGIEGVIFVRVEPGGPADRAGLRPLRRDRRGRVLLGDIITGIDGEPVRSREDLT